MAQKKVKLFGVVLKGEGAAPDGIIFLSGGPKDTLYSPRAQGKLKDLITFVQSKRRSYEPPTVILLDDLLSDPVLPHKTLVEYFFDPTQGAIDDVAGLLKAGGPLLYWLIQDGIDKGGSVAAAALMLGVQLTSLGKGAF